MRETSGQRCRGGERYRNVGNYSRHNCNALRGEWEEGKERAIAVMLTGKVHDGAPGVQKIKQVDGRMSCSAWPDVVLAWRAGQAPHPHSWRRGGPRYRPFSPALLACPVP